MCNPTAIAIAASVGQGFMNAKATADQMDADAANLELKAFLGREKAKDARARGAEAEGAIRMKTTQAVADNKLAYVQGSADVGSGSPLDLLADTRMVGELDALQARNNGFREAWGYDAQATLDQAAAGRIKKNRNMALVGSFLGPLANVAVLAGGKGKA